MNSKERVLTVVDHKPADRAPVTNRYTSEIARELARIVAVDPQDKFGLEVALGHDMLCTKEMGIVNAYDISLSERVSDDEYVDDFGMIKKIIPYEGGAYAEIVKYPLADLDVWSSYQFPDPDQQPSIQRQFAEYEEGIARYGDTHAIVGGVTCTVFEGAQMLRGISQLMVDLYDNEDFVNELMDELVQYHFKVGKKLIDLGVDILYIGDDVGSQKNMLISPKLFRKYLRPRYDYLFREWRKIRSDIIFAFHTDGHVEPIIPDLIDVGLDILNPIQPETMDDRRLKREFGDQLSFWGGINVQQTIPFGTPADVVAEVREKFDTYGKGGGFIISASHNVQPNPRSVDNTMIFYWACRRYGEYRDGNLAG
jgi:uroporphyrinogen decarboxylase